MGLQKVFHTEKYFNVICRVSNVKIAHRTKNCLTMCEMHNILQISFWEWLNLDQTEIVKPDAN